MKEATNSNQYIIHIIQNNRSRVLIRKIMKLATCVLVLCACLLHQVSAQQNWWERDENGTPVISTSRTTTSTAAPTPAPATPTNCPCPRTPEYNPVCGDNRVTYDNPSQLECAKSCGQSVRLLFHGRCEKLT